MMMRIMVMITTIVLMMVSYGPSHHVISRHMTSYHVMSRRITSYHVIPRHVMSYIVISRHTMLLSVLLPLLLLLPSLLIFKFMASPTLATRDMLSSMSLMTAPAHPTSVL